MIDRSLNYGRENIVNFFRRINSPSTIVDIGAGGGSDLESASKVHPNAKLIAIEGYPPSVEVLRGKGITTYPKNVEVDLLPFEKECIDVYISNQTLEHCKEIYWIFHEISRTLRVGGYLIIGVPNLASLHNRLLLLMGRQPTSIQSASAHIRGFTLNDLMRFHSTCFPGGYSLETYSVSNYYPFPPMLAKPLAKMLPNSSVCIFLLLKKQKRYDDQFIEYPVTQRLETNYWLGKD